MTMIKQLVSDDERITIGTGTYASSQPLLRVHHPNNKIMIGNYCSFASEVTIFAGGNHPLECVTTHPLKLYFEVADFQEWSKDCGDGDDVTKIGNDVWIGHGATILSGVTIGDGAIIGAKAVVASDVAPYAIVVGNPGKVLKFRFSQEVIDKLIAIAWWNWSEDKIKKNIDYLCSKNIERFFLSTKEHQ